MTTTAKRTRTGVSIALLAVLATGLTACGGSSDQEAGDPTSSYDYDQGGNDTVYEEAPAEPDPGATRDNTFVDEG